MITLPCGCVRHEGFGHVNTKLCEMHHHAHFAHPAPKLPVAGPGPAAPPLPLHDLV